MFSRLQLGTTLLAGLNITSAVLPQLEITSADERSGFIPCITSAVFTSLDEARHMLDKLCNWYHYFFVRNYSFKFVPEMELPVALLQEKSELISQYERWSAALEELVAQQMDEEMYDLDQDGTSAQAFRDGVTMLKLSHRTTLMLIKANFPLNEESVFAGTSITDSEEVLEWAESLLAMSSADASSSSPTRTFSAESGPLGSLAFLALKSYDDEIANKALSLLSVSARRESLIDTEMIIRHTNQLLYSSSDFAQRTRCVTCNAFSSPTTSISFP